MFPGRSHTRASAMRRLIGNATLLFALLSLSSSTMPAQLNIYLDSTQQVIRGFGAANILPWRPDMTSDQITKAFGTGAGQVGFSLLRLRLSSSSSEFPMNLPTAQAAGGMGVTIFASPWSPPASLKTNNNIVAGSLADTSYASYAAYLKSFVDYMAGNGVQIYAVSVQNEPDASVTYESCSWNSTQMLNFMKNNAPSVGAPVCMPESESFVHSLSDAALSDSVAAPHIAFVAGHIYGGGLTSYPLATSKGKELWMTEHLDTDTSWTAVLNTGKEMNDCMSAGMSAYVTWYIVRYYGPIGDDGSVTKRGYVMSQYARFIRPGFNRVFNNYLRGSLYVTAYRSNASVVIVAVNLGSTPVQQQFSILDLANAGGTLTPYVTSRSKNCEQQSGITVVNGQFTATIADSSVTTFVGDITTGVGDRGPAAPRTYALYQNYPNPFNPTTEITFEIPVRSRVMLKVFNVLGQQVATILNDVEDAGVRSVQFDARALPSGTYLYRLQANDFTETKEMILLK